MLDFQTWEDALALVKKGHLAIRATNEKEKKQLIALSGASGCSSKRLLYNFLIYCDYGFGFAAEGYSLARGKDTNVMSFSEVLSQIETQNMLFTTLDKLL